MKQNTDAFRSLFLQSIGGTAQDFLKTDSIPFTQNDFHKMAEDLLKKEVPKETIVSRWNLCWKSLDWLKKNEARHIWPGHRFYPASFYDLELPPVSLTYWGNIHQNYQKSLAIVGSREVHPLSQDWMSVHLSKLAKDKICFVSGGARGVDQIAHFIAFTYGAPTVAFLPSGLASCYPPSLKAFIPEIVKTNGAVVSELLPFDPIKNHYFHQRNRLIVALAPTLLLVEARRKSGSIMTARLAVENHRNLAIVPGSPMLPNWEGSLDLLGNGAFPIRDTQDLEALLSVPVFSQVVRGHNTKKEVGIPNGEPCRQMTLPCNGVSSHIETPVGNDHSQ